MGDDRPLHAGFLHFVFFPVFRRAVAADEDNLESVVLAVPQFDQSRGEGLTGRSPSGGETKTDDSAAEDGEVGFFARDIDQPGADEVFE